MPEHTGKQLFFDASQLPVAQNSYVAWVDVMGVRAIMGRSLPITANFVFKLHAAALEEARGDVKLYPVMDGVFVVCSGKLPLTGFLKSVFSRVADEFVSTDDMHHRFVIKAAVAYGPVVHGCDLPAKASYTLANNAGYRDSILLGMPMIQTVQGESKAAPYGIFIHESARAFAPAEEEPFRHLWWHWFLPQWRDLAKRLQRELLRYFEWCEQRSHLLEYEKERIKVHGELSSQYFVDLESEADEGTEALAE